MEGNNQSNEAMTNEEIEKDTRVFYDIINGESCPMTLSEIKKETLTLDLICSTEEDFDDSHFFEKDDPCLFYSIREMLHLLNIRYHFELHDEDDENSARVVYLSKGQV